MDLIKWRDSYSVGVDEIDKQHIQLVDIINELNEAVMDCRSEEVLDSVFVKLHEYAIYHFSTEEEYMRMLNYPHLIQHMQIHDEFRAAIAEFSRKFTENKSFASMQLVMYLRDWFVNHVCFSDSMIKPYVNNLDKELN